MPYTNITFVKIFWKELLHKDDRFVEQLNDEQKGLYLMLLVLAGATENNIKHDPNYLKRVLNLQENSQKVIKNLNKICEVFPKLISKNGYLKFKNFNKLHNYLRNADGTPKESQRLAKNRIEKIRGEYIKIKGFRLEDFSSDDYARTAKAIKRLVLKSNNKDDLVIECIKWVSQMGYCDWTLETCSKKWLDFMKFKDMPKAIPEYHKPKEEPYITEPPKEFKELVKQIANKKGVIRNKWKLTT